MTDNTQPEALAAFYLELPMTDKTDLIREIHEYVTAHGGENTATHLLVQAASVIQTQAAELEAVGAGGVSGPLMGRASLSANAGEPVAWQYRSLRDNGAWFDCTKERFEMRCTQPEIWETRALYAAPPTAQAEGWRPIETAPKGELVLLWSEITRGAPFIGDWAEYARYNHPQFTHWSRWDGLPPTSAEGVEHG